MKGELIVGLVEGVTKKWAKQRRAEERKASRAYYRHEALTRTRRITIKEATEEVMEEAYMHASTGNTLPAHARQIMYAARNHIQSRTGRTLNDQYFCQGLLPDYLNEHTEQTASWDVVFDARGHLTEPHTELIVPLGTIDVRSYLHQISSHSVNGIGVEVAGGKSYPTKGPKHRYSAILFLEKEGFNPLLKKVKLAERYDIAIMSTKGLSVTAARMLVDELCHSGVPLLVLHDFDKAGFSILGTLQRDTRRYEFANDVEVIDLGLRLEDVRMWDLQSESVSYGKTDPSCNLRQNGAGEEEIAFLVEGGSGNRGQRVELNAFASGDLVKWIEGKLKEHGIKKVVPDAETLEAAYRRSLHAHLLNQRLEEIAEEVQEQVEEAEIPRLFRKVRKAVKDNPERSWDDVIARFAGEQADDLA